MLLIGVFVLFAVLCFVLTAVFWRFYSDALAMFFVTVGVAFIVAIICAVVLLLSVRLPSGVSDKRIDVETRYSSLTYALTLDESKRALLAGDIAAYNSEVLQGRSKLHNIWLCDYQYPFWDEMPLIKYGEVADE